MLKAKELNMIVLQKNKESLHTVHVQAYVLLLESLLWESPVLHAMELQLESLRIFWLILERKTKN